MRERPEQYQVRAKDLAEGSIEKCWIPLWDKVSRSPMSKEISTYFFKLMLMSESDAKDIINECLDKKSFMAQIIHKSMKPRFDLDMDYKTTLWLTLTVNSPGTAVMYFAYLKWQMHQRHITNLTFEDFIKIFPMGFPTSEELDWLWQCQKIRCETDEERAIIPDTGNLLDYGPAYNSFC